MDQQQAIWEVQDELQKATAKFGRFASAHEGYAVIKEELDELWDAIKTKDVGIETQAIEARQVAAMAVRFLVDLCP